MVNILEDIVKHKKQEVKKSKQAVRVSELFNLIQNLPAPRLFCERLHNENRVSIIAEIKKASPSAGILCQNFNPVDIAKSYEANGAQAISVLTDEKYFEGKIRYLQEVRQHVSLPLLRKDFIIDPYQVMEARAGGADAILLIFNLLSKTQRSELVQAACTFHLEILAEVHTVQELESALEEGLNIIGINNRNLKTFEVNLATTEKLIASISKEVLVVSESGIKQKKDIEYLGKLGVDAVLIGERFMRESDVGEALKKFVGVPKWSR